MRGLCVFLMSVMISSAVFANDGTYYYISGNSLIPMIETDITVKKEILTMKRLPRTGTERRPELMPGREYNHQVELSIYYEFFNPGERRKIIVGYECHPSSGVNLYMFPSLQKGDPYIHDFEVKMNGRKLKHKVAVVESDYTEKPYFQNGKFLELTKKELEEDEDPDAGFSYVYYFDADFKEGLNVIEQTLVCDMTHHHSYAYEFYYKLTPAMRWGNAQIDDFTLNVDMGSEQVFHIDKTFFRKNSDWKIIGTGRMSNLHVGGRHDEDDEGNLLPEEEQGTATRFYIKEGYLQFKKKDFKTDGEFNILSFGYPSSPLNFDYKTDEYLYPDLAKQKLMNDDTYMWLGRKYIQDIDSVSRVILRDLPYARRGYVFPDPVVQKYFESQIWYTPDPAYRINYEALSPNEKRWIYALEGGEIED